MQESSLVLTTAWDNPTKKAVARADGEVLEMLRRIEKGRKSLAAMRRTLSSTKSIRTGTRIARESELERGGKLAQRLNNVMKELKRVERTLPGWSPVDPGRSSSYRITPPLRSARDNYGWDFDLEEAT